MSSVEFDEQKSYVQADRSEDESKKGLASLFVGTGLVKSEKGANFLGLFLAIILIAIAIFIFSSYAGSTNHLPIPVQVSR